jgi:NADPH:quinone reductase-like Zn-dependent oxidoreductase
MPIVGSFDVVLRPRAVSLNYRDSLVVAGAYATGGRTPAGAIPCSDAAGDIVAIGDRVTRVRVGDRVTSTFAPDWIAGSLTRAALRTTLGSGQGIGVLAERVVLPETAVVPVPAGLSFDEAATLPCAALTAWHALFEEVAVGPGLTVLTLGSGGVSTFALQFAVHAGATVIATSSDDQKLERMRARGARHGVNYRETPAWGERVRDLAGGEGVDVVIEVGGQGTLEQSCRAVRPGGTIALIGTVAGPASVNLTPVLLRNIRVQGVTVGSREMFDRMNQAIAAWQIRPVIDRIFPFEDAPRAYHHLVSGQHIGKIVIRVDDSVG